MSWHKITLPLTMEIDPQIVKIGDLARACYNRENKPEGFGILHATRGSEDGNSDTRIVYFSPVASEVCREVGELYPLEPCEVPARDEPNVAWVFGDPLVMGWLKDKWEPTPEEAEYARRASLEQGIPDAIGSLPTLHSDQTN